MKMDDDQEWKDWADSVIAEKGLEGLEEILSSMGIMTKEAIKKRNKFLDSRLCEDLGSTVNYKLPGK
jgi:hypothetical protein